MARCSLFISYLYENEEEFEAIPYPLTIRNEKLASLILYIGNYKTIEEIIEKDKEDLRLITSLIGNRRS